jgi:3-deoxy-manno-octulosonate cytidylyltransferase (CMP-KDO synthetase)
VSANFRLRALAVLPARLASTRLPRKVLLAETGLPLFVHSARNVQSCAAIDEVLVATDEEAVAQAAREHDVPVRMTSPDHVSGTDRVYEAVQAQGGEWDGIINVQADEPEVDPEDLASLVTVFQDPAVEIATLCTPITDDAELASSSAVKLVRKASGDALYFSRARIPDTRHARPGAPAPQYLRHLGVYAFRPSALARCCALSTGTLESLESLEQLRWLEAGESLRVLDARRAPRGIDTREDYDAFVALHAGRSQAGPGLSTPR